MISQKMKRANIVLENPSIKRGPKKGGFNKAGFRTEKNRVISEEIERFVLAKRRKTMFKNLIILKQRWSLTITILGVACLLGNSSAIAQNTYSMFMDLDGVHGDSLDPTYYRWIEIKEFKEGTSKASVALAWATNPLVQPYSPPMEILKGLDLSSVSLRSHASSGKRYRNAAIIVRRNSQPPITIFRLDLEGVVIVSVHTNCQETGSLIPEETVAIRYSSVKWTYIPVNPDGSSGGPITTGYDFFKNGPIGLDKGQKILYKRKR
jgi:type VI secretion system secreted protein Hcp